MDKRTCCKCKEEQPIENFSKNSKGKFGRHSRCKSCCSTQSKEIYKRLGKNYYLKSAYGMSESDLYIKFQQQQGRCAICNAPIDLAERHKRSACVDHNHTTGQVRSLLCNHCNKGLGLFLDNPELLRNAADYLDKWCGIRDVETIQSWISNIN